MLDSRTKYVDPICTDLTSIPGRFTTNRGHNVANNNGNDGVDYDGRLSPGTTEITGLFIYYSKFGGHAIRHSAVTLSIELDLNSFSYHELSTAHNSD